MVKKIRGFMAYNGPTPWFATPSFLGDVYGLNSPRDDSIVNYFNGLVGKSEQESIDFPIIWWGVSGENFPLNQSIPVMID